MTVWGWCTDKRRRGIPEGRVTGNVELLTLQENVAKPWNRVREGLGCETVGNFRQLLLAVCLCPCVCLAGLCVYVFVRVSSSGPGRRGVIRRPTDFGGAAPRTEEKTLGNGMKTRSQQAPSRDPRCSFRGGARGPSQGSHCPSARRLAALGEEGDHVSGRARPVRC